MEYGLFAKILYGVTRVATTTLTEYCLGYTAGYLLGSVVGIPGLFFGKTSENAAATAMSKFRSRLGTMHTNNAKWGHDVGRFSAAFRGCETAVLLLRYEQNEEWSRVMAQPLAGAFLSRKGMYGKKKKRESTHNT